MEIPTRSELLAGWMLPILSSSVAAGEKESEAIALFKSVERLAAKQKEAVKK